MSETGGDPAARKHLQRAAMPLEEELGLSLTELEELRVLALDEKDLTLAKQVTQEKARLRGLYDLATRRVVADLDDGGDGDGEDDGPRPHHAAQAVYAAIEKHLEPLGLPVEPTDPYEAIIAAAAAEIRALRKAAKHKPTAGKRGKTAKKSRR